MRASALLVGLLAAVGEGRKQRRDDGGLLKDINVISKYWGQVSPYFENEEDQFGVEDVGLPDGCQVVRTLTSIGHVT